MGANDEVVPWKVPVGANDPNGDGSADSVGDSVAGFAGDVRPVFNARGEAVVRGEGEGARGGPGLAWGSQHLIDCPGVDQH